MNDSTPPATAPARRDAAGFSLPLPLAEALLAADMVYNETAMRRIPMI